MLPISSIKGACLRWPSIPGSHWAIGPRLIRCEMKAIRLWVCKKFVASPPASTTKTKYWTMVDQFNNTIKAAVKLKVSNSRDWSFLICRIRSRYRQTNQLWGKIRGARALFEAITTRVSPFTQMITLLLMAQYNTKETTVSLQFSPGNKWSNRAYTSFMAHKCLRSERRRTWSL